MSKRTFRIPLLDDAVYFLTATILVLLPYHAFLSVWLGTSIGAYRLAEVWKELLIILLFVVVVLRSSSHALRDYINRNKLLLSIIGIYAFVTCVSGLVAYGSTLIDGKTLVFALIINLRFVLFFLVAHLSFSLYPRSFKWLKIVIIPALPVLVFALLQAYFLPPRFLEHFGYSKLTILPFQYVNNHSTLLRVQSFLRGANPLGAYLVVILTATLYGLLHVKSWKNRLVWTGLFAIEVLTLFYTYSRSAWLGAAISVFCIGILAWKAKRGRWIFGLSYGLVLAGVLVAMSVAGVRHNTTVQNAIFHSDHSSLKANTSDGIRALRLKEGLGELASHPLGTGLGTAGPASVDNTYRAAFVPENYFLQVGLEVGVLGLLLFVVLNVIVAYRLWTHRGDGLSAVLLACLIGITFINLVSHAWADDTLSLMWWGLAGIALATDQQQLLERSRTVRRNIVMLASTFPRWVNDTVPGFVLEFARRIAPQAGKVTVVAPHYAGAKDKETFEPDIAVRRFRYAYPYKFENAAYGQFKKTKFYPLKMLSYIVSEFGTTLLVSLRTRPAVINAHWLIPQGFVGVLVGKMVSAKIIVSVHGSDVFTLNGKYMRKVKRFTLRHADVVVANSSATQAACKDLYRGKDYPIVPMGIDVDKFQAPRRKHKGYEVIFVGRLAPHKGVMYLCEAMQQLHGMHHDMHLTIIGEGPERKIIEEYIAQHQLESAVSLAGWVQPDELPERLAGADVFAGPSVEGAAGEKEALGLVFAEASAAGLPVVATDIGGIKDVVQDEETGLLVPQKDTGAIRDALAYLYAHRREGEAMGKRGQTFVRANFSWQSVAERYTKIFGI